MNDPAELEINLYASSSPSSSLMDRQYSVELRYTNPDDSENRAPRRGTAKFNFDLLSSMVLEPDLYGQQLATDLLADQRMSEFFSETRSDAERTSRPLRLRLLADPNAPELNDLHWETLADPRDGSWLLSKENVLFSRFLSDTSWAMVGPRARGELRALVIIANPPELKLGRVKAGGKTLAEVDVEGEKARAGQGLKGLPLDYLVSDPDQPGQVTLNAIIEKLREGYDIIYLACHGALLPNADPPGPYLLLDSSEGNLIHGKALTDRINNLPFDKRPRLFVLASCQSGGTGSGDNLRTADTQGALSAIGPQLAEAGVPAVIAMQGDISMEAVKIFMPRFFSELLNEGQIDYAMSVARGDLTDRLEASKPILYLRLRGGRLWYTPGFGGTKSTFDQWRGLLRSILKKQCTPILGPGLYEAILGSQREIATEWAQEFHYPMRLHERESLPQVSQFLATNQYQNAPFDELEEYLKGRISRMHSADLAAAGLDLDLADLDEMIDAVGKASRTSNPNDPYRLLADLNLPIYINTNSHDLLVTALTDAGKTPQVALCPWNDAIVQQALYKLPDDFIPSSDTPLVYYLYGRINKPKSLVLTEDNYFDFLIGVARNKELIPEKVRRAWASTSLLFLGFQVDDWQFRILFRTIMAQAGGALLEDLPHIAVQLEPEAGVILEPQRARGFLETYFSKNANINLYWGSSNDFLSELNEQLAARKQSQP